MSYQGDKELTQEVFNGVPNYITVACVDDYGILMFSSIDVEEYPDSYYYGEVCGIWYGIAFHTELSISKSGYKLGTSIVRATGCVIRPLGYRRGCRGFDIIERTRGNSYEQAKRTSNRGDRRSMAIQRYSRTYSHYL